MRMREEFLELRKLGQMPDESIDDDASIDDVVASYDALLGRITPPITCEECEVLIELFPENAFYDLQWRLLKLVESLMADDKAYRKLIDRCPSREWRETLNARFRNFHSHLVPIPYLGLKTIDIHFKIAAETPSSDSKGHADSNQ